MKCVLAIIGIFFAIIISTGCIGERLGTVAYSESNKPLETQKLPSVNSQNNNAVEGIHCEQLYIVSKKVMTGDFPDRRFVNAIRKDIANNQYFISLTTNNAIYQNISERTTINATVISDPYYGHVLAGNPSSPTILSIIDSSC